MLPTRLEIKNFLAYRSPEPIVFEGIHLACITGANGAGKSSLLDAITWALWGKARARRDEELVHLGQTDMYVQLDFVSEDTVYRVVRRRTRKSGGAGMLDLFVVREGELETRSEASVRATQQKINELLRLDYETFVHSAFLQQGKADAFTMKPPAQRKQILSDILGLERWAAYEDLTKERLKSIGESLASIEGRIADIDAELAREPELQATLEAAEQATAEAKAALDVADKRLREVEHAPNDLRNAQERKATLERQLLEREREHSAALTEIKKQMERIGEYESVLAARAEIEQGFAALQAAREADHTLADKLMQLNTFENERRELERKLDAARAEIQNEISRCEATIIQLQRTIDAADPDALSEVQAEVLALEALEKQRDEFDQQARDKENECAELKGGNDKLRAEMNQLKDRIDRLKVASGVNCPLCGQPLDEEHRAQLLAELEAEGKQRGDTYRANEARYKGLVDEVAQLKRRVSDLTLELKRLPGRRDQAAALKAQIDARNEAERRLAEQQGKLDSARQTLAAEQYGEQIRAEIAALDEKRNALDYDKDRHTAARQQLEQYRDYEARQRQLELADSALPDMRGALEAANQRKERIEKALVDDRKALDDICAEIERLESLVQEYHQRDAEFRLYQRQWQQANDKLVEAKQELKALEGQKKRKTELEAQRVEKKRQKSIFEELKVAFGKNGIPAMIIETAIPELEAGANDILHRMTDGRMSLSMSTQREKVTGGVAETLDIQIADELGTRSYEMYSGGEAFRINFAIRVALSQLLARRAGAHLRTLFIDEGFGTQDEDGRNKLVEAITTVQDDFDLILVITHLDDLRDSFPVHIMLEKTGDGSRVAVR